MSESSFMLKEGMRAVKLSEQVNVHYIQNHLLDMPALKKKHNSNLKLDIFLIGMEYKVLHKIQLLEDLPFGCCRVIVMKNTKVLLRS